MVSTAPVSVGAKVAKGDKLLTHEAMKMQTTVYAAVGGMVAEILRSVGDAAQSRDLLMRLRRAKSQNR